MTEILNDTNFDEKIKNGRVLIDFYADWCGPCKMLSPIIDEINSEIEDAKIYKVNVDESSELALKHNIKSLPTLMVFEDGKDIHRQTGITSKSNIIDMLKGDNK